VYNQDYYA